MTRAPAKKARAADLESPSVRSLKALKALGVPGGPKRLLMVGWTDPAALEAGRSEFKPRELACVDVETNPDAFVAAPLNWPSPEQGLFDLIVAGDLFGCGRLAGAVAQVQALAALLSDRGVAVIAVPTCGLERTGPRSLEPLLFPALGASGTMGSELALRPPLGPASWMMLFHACGLRVTTADGYGTDPAPADLIQTHRVRLNVYDEREISTGVLFVRVVGPGTEQ